MSPKEDQWFGCLAQGELFLPEKAIRLRELRDAYFAAHPNVAKDRVLAWVDFTLLEPGVQVMSTSEFESGVGSKDGEARDLKYYDIEKMARMLKERPEKGLVAITVLDREMTEYHCLSVTNV